MEEYATSVSDSSEQVAKLIKARQKLKNKKLRGVAKSMEARKTSGKKKYYDRKNEETNETRARGGVRVRVRARGTRCVHLLRLSSRRVRGAAWPVASFGDVTDLITDLSIIPELNLSF